MFKVWSTSNFKLQTLTPLDQSSKVEGQSSKAEGRRLKIEAQMTEISFFFDKNNTDITYQQLKQSHANGWVLC